MLTHHLLLKPEWIFICLSLTAAAVRTSGDGDFAPLRTTPAEDNLRMREGAPFKIALFADLHFGEDAWTEWGPRQDINSVRVMSAVLDNEQPACCEPVTLFTEVKLLRNVAEKCKKCVLNPQQLLKTNTCWGLRMSQTTCAETHSNTVQVYDFVIYLGDIITANNIMTKNASSYWDQALSPTRARGVPWCTIFGNHDDAPFEWPLEWFSQAGIPPRQCTQSSNEECSFRGTTRLELIKSEISDNTLSRSKNGPTNLWPSVSNYVVRLSSSTSSEEEPIAYMYFFDSGGGTYPEVISDAQVKWFEKKSGEVNPDSRIPEIIFWHIPSKAYKKVAPKMKVDRQCVGSIFLEEVAAQEAEMGIMKVLEQRASVKAVFVGHNHGLDWCCPYKKMWLCFARHTGYGGYGDWARGARILQINQRPFSLKSWITMEDGHTHSELILGP